MFIYDPDGFEFPESANVLYTLNAFGIKEIIELSVLL